MKTKDFDRTFLVAKNKELFQRIKDGQGPLCIKPWTSLDERFTDGQLLPCCWANKEKSFGRVENAEDALSLWHGERAAYFRKKMASGRLESICKESCPVLKNRANWFEKQELREYSEKELVGFPEHFLVNRLQTMESALSGKSEIKTYPIRLKLAPSNKCNLRCIMCHIDFEKPVERDWYKQPIFPELKKYLEEMKLNCGEPLMCKTSKRILLDENVGEHDHLQYSFITNGALLTEEVINKLKARRIGFIDVSLDSPVKETYERIRLRGNYELTLRGLDRLVELRNKHPVARFDLFGNFVVQEANYNEMAKFVKFCSTRGITANFSLVSISDVAMARAKKYGTEMPLMCRDLNALRSEMKRAARMAIKLNDAKTQADLERMVQSTEKSHEMNC